MIVAYPFQKFQDWFTQQWIIIFGKKLDKKKDAWLIGPIGEIGIIADEYINQIAKDEGLTINRESSSQGLIPSIEILNLSENELNRLSKNVISFYQNTSNYKLRFSLKWNPIFRIFGIITNKLFSERIKQLNIPIKDIEDSKEVKSEVITLYDSLTNRVKYTIWFRTIKSSGQVLFSGFYGFCTLPNGKSCIKAVFPLPKGNATFILSPSVGKDGELILDSSGKKFGEQGFYFLLQDSKGNFWSQNHRSFRDKLIVSSNSEEVKVEHTQTLWHQRVLKFNYVVNLKNKLHTT